MKLQTFIPLILLCLIIAGCIKESDLQSPATRILHPTDGDTLFTDEELRLVATLEDNGALNQYRLTLDGNDELNGFTADSAISLLFIDDLAEDEFYIERVFDIPDTLMNGHYILAMKALDQAGNESEADSVAFFFKNRNDTVQPTFVDTVIFDTINVVRGGLMVNIDVFDDELVYCKLTVKHEDGTTLIYENEWIDVYYNWVTMMQWIAYEETRPEGNFIYHVLAIDRYGYKEYTNSVYFDK